MSTGYIEEEDNIIRPKREPEPQSLLGVIIESALTGQHHGFGIVYTNKTV